MFTHARPPSKCEFALCTLGFGAANCSLDHDVLPDFAAASAPPHKSLQLVDCHPDEPVHPRGQKALVLLQGLRVRVRYNTGGQVVPRFLHVFMYVYVCACLTFCVYIHKYVYIYIYTYIPYIYIYIHIYIYRDKEVCIYIYI